METSAEKITAARRRNIKKAIRARLSDPDKMRAENSRAGMIGGKARAQTLTAEELQEIRCNNINVRWEKEAMVKYGKD